MKRLNVQDKELYLKKNLAERRESKMKAIRCLSTSCTTVSLDYSSRELGMGIDLQRNNVRKTILENHGHKIIMTRVGKAEACLVRTSTSQLHREVEDNSGVKALPSCLIAGSERTL